MAARHTAVISWYDEKARDLPWRGPDVTPWGVLVSEVMLQQTPVVRVLPVWQEWMARWPTPSDLASAPLGDVLRAWGRLGYPRRALRLHETAQVVTERYAGTVPATEAQLGTLPGIGRYTAAAVAAFAYGAHTAPVDTNIRRVLARVVTGVALPAPSATAAEWALAEACLPSPELSPQWNIAVMELGALICTQRTPRCDQCPLATTCTWRARGYPPYDGPPRPRQAWHGTDRQARGAILAALRHTPVAHRNVLLATWSDPTQAARALAGLVTDGLAVEDVATGEVSLPS